MWIVLIFTIVQLTYADLTKTTSPVTIVLDGFTLDQWNRESIWNDTQILIIRHLNKLCRNDDHCNADYELDNLHLFDVTQDQPSSIRLSITVDEPILPNYSPNEVLYNYTALLTSALFQAKIDIEHLHDNQRSDPMIDSTKNGIRNRMNRLLLMLLGISVVTLIFAITILFFQKVRHYQYTKLLRTTATSGQTQDDLVKHCPSTTIETGIISPYNQQGN